MNAHMVGADIGVISNTERRQFYVVSVGVLGNSRLEP
jgi:hypothetical protein